MARKNSAYGPYSPYNKPYPPNPTCYPVPESPVPSSSFGCWVHAYTSPSLWLLAPAVLEIGAFLAVSASVRKRLSKEIMEPRLSLFAIDTFTLVASIGVALYIFLELADNGENPVQAFIPIGLAIGVVILLFASAFTAAYRLFPKSFKGDVGQDIMTQFFSFLYLSINTFATAGDGDIFPATTGTKMLVSLELLFFVYIIALGIALFAHR